MVAIPKQRSTLALIEAGLSEESTGRDYLGLSGIGEECLLRIQLSFRMSFVKRIGHRTQRIFNTGHLAEEFMIRDLKRAGVDVYGQQEEIIGFAGHWKGHIDGRCIGVLESPEVEHLAEFKTMADKYFKAVCKKGVLLSNPKYYAQMQAYMGYLKIKRALFMAYNKNTSEYYIERVEFDSGYFRDLQRKEQIILEEMPAPRIGNPETWYQCKLCDARALCLGLESPVRNCRTCGYSDACDDGIWECSFNGQYVPVPIDIQRVGCRHYSQDEFFDAL